jgi:hypothetical protein
MLLILNTLCCFFSWIVFFILFKNEMGRKELRPIPLIWLGLFVFNCITLILNLTKFA